MKVRLIFIRLQAQNSNYLIIKLIMFPAGCVNEQLLNVTFK